MKGKEKMSPEPSGRAHSGRVASCKRGMLDGSCVTQTGSSTELGSSVRSRLADDGHISLHWRTYQSLGNGVP